MRTPSASDYPVPVEGVGEFTFGRRSMRDHIAINVEYSRLTAGVNPTDWLDMVCTCMATIKVLAVHVPDGFDIDAMDPLDPETYDRLLRVHAAMRVKEDSFRRPAKTGGPGAGQAPGADGGVLVSSQVQPGAAGSPVP